MTTIRFGVFLSLERPDFNSILSDAKLVESLGYDSVWLADHLIGMYKEPGASRFECWTASTALMAMTSTIRLGQLVLCNPFRQPQLLAKMAASLDVISGGRIILGLGAGWHEGEFNAYGYDFESPMKRVRRLDEAATIIKAMWGEETVDFSGRHYRIEKAYCSPKPVQKPHPPLLIAGAGEQLTLKTVARHADMSNYAAWIGKPEEFKAKSCILDKHCERVGRDPKEITRSWATYCVIDEGYRNELASTTHSDRQTPLCGPPDQVKEQVESYIEAGVSYFIIRFMGKNLRDEASLFARKVLTDFK